MRDVFDIFIEAVSKKTKVTVDKVNKVINGNESFIRSEIVGHVLNTSKIPDHVDYIRERLNEFSFKG
jgi:hypothetical protein